MTAQPRGTGGQAVENPVKDGLQLRGTTWTAYWYVRDPATGKFRQRTKGGFAGKTAAKKFRDTQLVAVAAGTYSEPKDKALTTADFLRLHWLPAARHEATRSGAPRRETTVATLEAVTERWLIPQLGGVRVAALTPRSVEAALEALRDHGGRNGGPLGGRSVQVAHQVLRLALAYGLTNGYVTRNVAAVVRRPGAKAPVISAWTTDEARTFLAAVKGDQLYSAWLLLLTRGPRRGELAGLRWADVDLDGGIATIAHTRVSVGGKIVDSTPKTEAGKRQISLDPSLVAALKDHRRAQLEDRLRWGAGWTDTGVVFVREDGLPLSPESISQKFDRLCKRVGVRRIRLHDTRHTAASLMLAAGTPVKLVSEMLGHADARVTLTIYAHTTAEQHAEAGARHTAQLLGG